MQKPCINTVGRPAKPAQNPADLVQMERRTTVIRSPCLQRFKPFAGIGKHGDDDYRQRGPKSLETSQNRAIFRVVAIAEHYINRGQNNRLAAYYRVTKILEGTPERIVFGTDTIFVQTEQ